MKKLTTFVLSIFFISTVAQTYKVKGRLIDESTNSAIPLANIFLDSVFITVSDTSGNYAFIASKGNHHIKFTAFGFQELIKNISEAIFYSQLKIGEPYYTFAKNINLF